MQASFAARNREEWRLSRSLNASPRRRTVS